MLLIIIAATTVIITSVYFFRKYIKRKVESGTIELNPEVEECGHNAVYEDPGVGFWKKILRIE